MINMVDKFPIDLVIRPGRDKINIYVSLPLLMYLILSSMVHVWFGQVLVNIGSS